LMLHLDVQHRDTVKAAATEVKDKFGDLDILINNAGYLEKAQTVLESDEDDYVSIFSVS
jgi:NADP-dependent 3-hydroxy acid dehydrogenase YdfG